MSQKKYVTQNRRVGAYPIPAYEANDFCTSSTSMRKTTEGGRLTVVESVTILCLSIIRTILSPVSLYAKRFFRSRVYHASGYAQLVKKLLGCAKIDIGGLDGKTRMKS